MAGKAAIDKIFYDQYPNWPWVNLGTHVEKAELNLHLPERMSTLELVEKIKNGIKLQRLIEADVDMAYAILKEDFQLSAHQSNTRLKGQLIDRPGPFAEAWTVAGNTVNIDNRGVVRYVTQAKQKVASVATGEIVDRDYDYILSVLECLPIGNYGSKKTWETLRTASAVAYPYGPNVRVLFRQNKSYATGDKDNTEIHPPTNASYDNIYNIYDGIIIMTRHQPEVPGLDEKGKIRPFPPCADWSDVTMQQWIAMHLAEKRKSKGELRTHVDKGFPKPEKPFKNKDFVLFDKGKVAGRQRSPLRQPLKFYQKIIGADRYEMSMFLNYIISYGDSISNDTLAIIMRCLDSRDLLGTLEGKAPVWGNHDTFEAGSWEYNAMLASDIGYQVAMLLGRHKRPVSPDQRGGLGHHMVHSITIFATDSVKAHDYKTGKKVQRTLVKWPVVIWRICPFNKEIAEKALYLEAEYFDHAKDIHKMGDDGKASLPCRHPGAESPRLGHRYSAGGYKPRIFLPSEHIEASKKIPGNMVIGDLNDE